MPAVAPAGIHGEAMGTVWFGWWVQGYATGRVFWCRLGLQSEVKLGCWRKYPGHFPAYFISFMLWTTEIFVLAVSFSLPVQQC